MTQLLNRWFPSLTLACWSGILLYFSISGRLAAFLLPAFRPGVTIAGAILLVFAAGMAFAGPAPACCADNACEHPAVRPIGGRLLAFAALLLPLLLAVECPRAGFGVTVLQNRGVATDTAGISAKARPPAQAATPAQTPTTAGESTPDQFIPKTASGAIAVSVIDLLYAAQDPTLRVDFDGKTVEVIGQLMAQKLAGPKNNRAKVVRMFMTCCAADARPIAALVELPDAKAPIPELSWVRITGKPAFPFEGGRTIAVLKADSIAVTEPPEETMLY